MSVLCTTWWACTEGPGPTASGNAVALGIVPSFQIDPALFATDPIDRIRLTAYVASTRAVVGSFDESVSPTADEWAITLDIDLGDAESLQILVDAELLSQGTVAWSGRLGPLTVPTSAPALAMDVYPGPLENQDVTLIDIFGAPSVMVASTSVTLGAEISLIPGSDATPVIYWASSNEDVATVEALSGSTVTLTAVAPGTVDIIATAGPAYDEVSVEVLAPGSATKSWVGGDTGGSPTDWSNPANWNPAGVPTETDAVSIPITADTPVLSSGSAVETLVVADGAALDLNGLLLSVAADLSAGTSGVTNGTVRITGSGSLLEGAVPTLELLANRSLSASLYASGDLVLNGAELDTNGQFLSVSGGLSALGASARLVMTGTGNDVYAAGNVLFDGASHDGFLTGGSMSLAGDFTVTSSSTTGFAASGTHLVSFDGTAAQSVSFAAPGSTEQRFQDVSISNGNGVAFATDAYASGDVGVTGRMEVPLGSTVTIAGDLTLSSLSELDVEGTLDVLGQCIVNDGAVITGGGTQPCGAPTATDYTWVGGTSTAWEEPDNWSPAGVPTSADAVLIPGSTPTPVLSADAAVASITVSGSNALNLNGFTLTVSGDVSMGVSGGYTGLVHVAGAGTSLEGIFDDLRVSADRVVSGDLSVYGNLTVDNVLDTNGQTVTVLTDLTVQGPDAVLRMTTANTEVYVGGNALFNGGDHEGQMTEGFLTLAGNLTATEASPTSFVSSGNHWVQFSSGSGQTVSFQASGPTAQRFGNVEVFGLLGVTFATDVHVTGDVELGGRLDVAASTTTSVGGLLSLYGGSVLIANGSLTGSCVDNGGIILGDGAAICGTPLAVDRYWTGASSTSWNEPDNWMPANVPAPSESVLILYELNQPVLSQDVSLSGLTIHPNARLDLGGSFTLTVSGDLGGQGYVLNGTTVVTGAGGELEGYFESLVVEGARTTTGFLYTDLDMIIRNRLTVGPDGIQTSGDLTVEGAAGELVMDGETGVVYVLGTATFDGASLDGDLTGGDLYLYGDFTVGIANAPDAFRSTGTNVWFFGSTDQTVSFSNPGLDNGQQSFQNLSASKSAGSLIFASDAYVRGDLSASFQQVLVGNGATVLEVNGALTLNDVTFNGLALELITASATSELHSIQNVTFTGMDPVVTQLLLSLPPGAGGEPLVIESPTFLTVPADGAYYIFAENSSENLLTVQVNNPTPTDDSGYTMTFGNVEIIWGP